MINCSKQRQMVFCATVYNQSQPFGMLIDAYIISPNKLHINCMLGGAYVKHLPPDPGEVIQPPPSPLPLNAPYRQQYK